VAAVDAVDDTPARICEKQEDPLGLPPSLSDMERDVAAMLGVTKKPLYDICLRRVWRGQWSMHGHVCHDVLVPPQVSP
jgi:hypothetical protein